MPCEKCDQLGYIFVDDLDQSYFIICTQCGGETSNVWCPKCGMGGSFVRNIELHPATWTCADCETRYFLPPDFYDNPTSLFAPEELPAETRERIALSLVQPKLTPVSCLLLTAFTLAVIIVVTWPFAIMLLLRAFPGREWLLVLIMFAIIPVWIFLILPRTRIMSGLIEAFQKIKDRFQTK